MPATGATARYHEQIVQRAWGLGEMSEHAHSSRDQHVRQQPSGMGPMLQHWLDGNPREQPYNNIGSVITRSNSGNDAQDSQKEEAAKAQEKR